MKKILCLLLAVLLLCGCAPIDGGTAAESTFEVSQPVINTAETGTDEEILQKRRDIVEAEMRRITSTLWTPSEDIVYTLNSKSMGIEMDLQTDPAKVITLKAGRIYQGLPYTHGSGSGYSFFSLASGQDENGVYTISGLDTQRLSGNTSTRDMCRSRLGNDCADAVFWSWAQVSSSINFELTNFMTEYYGCLKVGDYDCNVAKYTDSTKPICKDNGEQRMYKAYSQLQKGDAMVLFTDGSGGHAVMVTDVHIEEADGVIDGANSYVTILEQTSGNLKKEKTYFDEALGQEVYIACGVDVQWSFETIFGKGYLPVTCKELVDPSPRPEEALKDTVTTLTVENILGGTLESNYRISSITATVTDSKGKTVQQATCYGRQEEMFAFNVARITNKQEQAVMDGSVDLDALSPGSYHCTLTCRLSTGREMVFRELDFTV